MEDYHAVSADLWIPDLRSVSIDWLQCVGGMVKPDGTSYSIYAQIDMAKYHPNLIRHICDNIGELELGRIYKTPMFFFVIQTKPTLNYRGVLGREVIEEFLPSPIRVEDKYLTNTQDAVS